MDARKSIWFIVNPISGTDDKKQIVEMIPKFFDEEKWEVRIVYTERKGHASELATEASRKLVDIVVAVGGDGTVNETARALIHTDTALGIVPCGSGNGLARHLYLPMNPEGAMQIIAESVIHALDYGEINGNPFFCTAGVGFDAFLSYKFNQSGKRGLVSYIENALKEGLKYQSETYELEIKGEENMETHKAFLITCANASQYGNDFYIAPHASMSDGLMDVTIMEPFNILEAPIIAAQLVSRSIDKNSRIKTFKCNELVIHRKHPGVIHYDGDPKEESADVKVKLVAKGIKVVVNTNKQPYQPPLLRAFNDLYNDMNEGLSTLREQLQKTPQRINTVNKEMLKKLTKN